MKSTAKSCSCRMCKQAKATRHGRKAMRLSERAFRHQQNTALRCGAEDIAVATHSGRVG